MKGQNIRLGLAVLALLAGALAACAPAQPITAPTPGAILPSSLKGYELYSWQQGDAWYFTLITGTNRLKTIAEIQAAENSVGADGFVKQTVAGAEALAGLLARLPQGETVTWLAGIPGETVGGLAPPPDEIVTAVAERARTLGLEFSVAR